MKRAATRIRSYMLRHRFKLSFFFILALTYWLWLPEKLFTSPFSKVLFSERGSLLAARIAPDGQWRFPESDSVPVKFKHCILAFEDEYFEYHPGVNPVSIFKSLSRNVSAGKVISGGSTITMQLARMMRHNQSRNYYQKSVELLLALRIELSYKKTSILKMYCSHAPFGSNVVGLGAASWRYYGRLPHQLSWAECATLAVLPNAPSLIYPGRNQQKLLEKRNRLLKKLKENGIIDEATCALALVEPLPGKPYALPQEALHLLERSIKENPGLDLIRSSVDERIQHNASEALNKHVASLAAGQVFNACALIAETQSGKVLAYIGNSSSPGNEHHNFVDVIAAPRSTGSILKPLLYAFMMQENRLLPGSLMEDIPTYAGSYEPANFNLTYDGLVPANEAIARSLNVPAVKMLQDYGSERFTQRLKQLGFTTFNKPSAHYGLSLILGGGEANLWELATAYARMGCALQEREAGGTYKSLWYLAQKETGREKKGAEELLSRPVLYFTLKAMSEVARPQDFANWARFATQGQVSWKTGTSFGFRDAWAIGLNKKYMVAVWVGNASGEGRPGLTGINSAAPLMFTLFNLLPRAPWFDKPVQEMEKLKVCSASGFKATEICPQAETQECPGGAAKTKPCPFHQVVSLDETETFRVHGECYPVHKMKQKAWLVISPSQEYYYKMRHPDYLALPPFMQACAGNEAARQMEILYPPEAFKIYVPTTENNQKSRCVFKATHKDKNAELFWYMDDVYLGSTRNYHEMPLLPAPGPHTLLITDNRGENARRTFEVLGK